MNATTSSSNSELLVVSPEAMEKAASQFAAHAHRLRGFSVLLDADASAAHNSAISPKSATFQALGECASSWADRVRLCAEHVEGLASTSAEISELVVTTDISNSCDLQRSEVGQCVERLTEK